MEDFRSLRIKQNMTQQQVAEKANISLRQLVRIEKKECYPNLETKILLFKALNVSKSDIIKYIEKNYIN
jgi:transcriptional regulator with XRE-family HTH domain